MGNPTLKRHIGLLAILLLIPSLGGAGLGISPTHSLQAPVFGSYQVKGFLSDYSRLRPAEGHGGAFLYHNPTMDRPYYKKLMIDPIKIWTKDNGWPREDDADVRDELLTYFHEAILKATAGIYQIVKTPGPDVLRLRIAVTDLEPNNPGVSMLTLIVPFLWIGEASAGAAQGNVGSTPFVGQATVEMEIQDSQTNAQLAAYIERHIGKKYNWDAGFSSGLSSYTKSFFTWAYTQEAFDRWADLLRAGLRVEPAYMPTHMMAQH